MDALVSIICPSLSNTDETNSFASVGGFRV